MTLTQLDPVMCAGQNGAERSTGNGLLGNPAGGSGGNLGIGGGTRSFGTLGGGTSASVLGGTTTGSRIGPIPTGEVRTLIYYPQPLQFECATSLQSIQTHQLMLAQQGQHSLLLSVLLGSRPR